MIKNTKTITEVVERWTFSAQEVRAALGIPEDAHVYLHLDDDDDMTQLGAVRRSREEFEE